MTPSNLFKFLKQNTTNEHREVEQHIGIGGNQFGIEEYKEYLKFLYQFYLSNEDDIENHLKENYDFQFEQHSKLKSLSEDLTALGTEHGHLASSNDLKVSKDSLSQLLGYVYVTEGSMLGGHVIQGFLPKRLGQPDLPMAFFNCYGKKLGAYWLHLNSLSSDNENEIDFNLTLNSAKRTFSVFKRFQPA